MCGGPLTALLAAKLNSEIELLTNYERGIMKTRLFSGVLIVLLSGKNKAVLMSSLTYILHWLVLVDGLIKGPLMKVVTISGMHIYWRGDNITSDEYMEYEYLEEEWRL